MKAAEVLKIYKIVAVVGLSANEERPSNTVARYLIRHGYQVIPVNPQEKQVLGLISYANLSEIPQKIEIVDIFRKSETIGPIVDEAIKVGAKVIWMQEGVQNDEAAKKAEAAGLEVFVDNCIKKTHERLTDLKLLQ